MKPAELRAWLADRGLLEPVVTAARDHHATLDEVFSRERTPRVAVARWAVWTALVDAGSSHVEIGRLWGVDHTTVRHGCTSLPRRTVGEAAE